MDGAGYGSPKAAGLGEGLAQGQDDEYEVVFGACPVFFNGGAGGLREGENWQGVGDLLSRDILMSHATTASCPWRGWAQLKDRLAQQLGEGVRGCCCQEVSQGRNCCFQIATTSDQRLPHNPTGPSTVPPPTEGKSAVPN